MSQSCQSPTHVTVFSQNQPREPASRDDALGPEVLDALLRTPPAGSADTVTLRHAPSRFAARHHHSPRSGIGSSRHA
eukprot:3939456-Rhodomonas_salina.4